MITGLAQVRNFENFNPQQFSQTLNGVRKLGIAESAEN